MKEFLKSGLMLALLVGTTAAPSFADPYEKAVEQEKTADKNAKRAANQEYKAERDAAEGNVAGADKHEANAQLDRYKTRKNETRANAYGAAGY